MKRYTPCLSGAPTHRKSSTSCSLPDVGVVVGLRKNSGPQTISNPKPVCEIRFYWNTAITYCLRLLPCL